MGLIDSFKKGLEEAKKGFEDVKGMTLKAIDAKDREMAERYIADPRLITGTIALMNARRIAEMYNLEELRNAIRQAEVIRNEQETIKTAEQTAKDQKQIEEYMDDPQKLSNSLNLILAKRLANKYENKKLQDLINKAIADKKSANDDVSENNESCGIDNASPKKSNGGFWQSIKEGIAEGRAEAAQEIQDRVNKGNSDKSKGVWTADRIYAEIVGVSDAENAEYVSNDALVSLAPMMLKNETIMAVASGRGSYWDLGGVGGDQGIMIATDRRLFMIQTTDFGFKHKVVPYEQITSVVSDKGLVSTSLIVWEGATKHVLKHSLGETEALHFMAVLNTAVEAYKETIRNGTANTQIHCCDNRDDTIEKLERLFALKEKGVLTEDEFIAQKAKILSPTT